MPAILEAARDAGAQFATYSIVRLPGSGAEVFADWLDRHVSPTKKQTILARIRESHGGTLNDLRFGKRMRGDGERAEQIGQLFHALAKRLGFNRARLGIDHRQFPATGGRSDGVGTLELSDASAPSRRSAWVQMAKHWRDFGIDSIPEARLAPIVTRQRSSGRSGFLTNFQQPGSLPRRGNELTKKSLCTGGICVVIGAYEEHADSGHGAR